MDAADPPVDGPTFLEPSSEGPTEPVVVPPPVVAVVVTRNPGPWLEDTLTGLSRSDYPSLTVLVLDAGSDVDPTSRIADVLPDAFVRRLDGSVGFAVAANEALGAVEGATFLMLCHDDVVLDPPAVRLLVEEAYRSNAGIVGPKLVEFENPEVLLEVGLAIDRFGVPYSGIEPGELDQEQRDGVRDVFFVSSAAMLVRADLFTELDGFDAETFPGGEDLDLCWRARLLGARVIVAPDARARHREAAEEKPEAERTDDALVLRHRLRAVLKSYSGWTLAWVVPLALVLGLLETVGFVASRRGVRARAVLGAWVWNLRHFGELRRARHEVQESRTVPDSELWPLQFRGSARVRTYVIDHLHAEERIRTVGDAGRSVADTARERLREPWVVAMVGFMLLVLLGSRELLFGRVPAVGALLPWPGVSGLVGAFTSGWRHSLLGSSAPAPPAFAAMGLAGTALLGATGLARTLLVVGALPLGVLGAYRLASPFVEARGPAAAAALAYGVNPVPRNALAGGRLGPLVFFALAPFLFERLLRAARLLPGTETAPVRTGRDRGRELLPLIVLAAVATALWPPAAMVLVVAAGACVLAAALVGGLRPGLRAVRVSLLALLGAVALLFPWPLELLSPGGRGASLGFAFTPRVDLSAVLRFQTGPAGAGSAGWTLLVAAALTLVVGRGPRLAWATRGWVLALVSFAMVWVPSRYAPHRAVPAPEGLLVLAALGVALSIGLGASTFAGDLRRHHFGWRQVAAVAAAIGLALPAAGFAADALGGRWRMPSTDWGQALSWMSSERAQGGFRVLWIGDPEVLPLDPSLTHDGVGYGLTTDGPGDARVLWPAPGGRAGGLVSRAIGMARDGRTDRLGRLLAPMGVRYVAVPERSGSDSGTTARAPAGLARALAGELDLTRRDAEGGLVLYENDAWVPVAAVATGDTGPVPVGSRDPSVAALRTDLHAAKPVRKGAAVAPGMVLWSEAYDGRWHASSQGHALEHVKALGWSNGFVHGTRGPVSIHYRGQLLRVTSVLVEVGLWLVVVWVWWRDRRLRGRRRRRGPGDPAASGDAGVPEPAR